MEEKKVNYTIKYQEKILYGKLIELSSTSPYIYYMFNEAFHSSERYAMMDVLIKMDAVIKEQENILEGNIIRQPIVIVDKEKKWQIIAGKMASIANWMYHNVDERTLSEDDVDTAHEMYQEILEILPFDEEAD